MQIIRTQDVPGLLPFPHCVSLGHFSFTACQTLESLLAVVKKQI